MFVCGGSSPCGASAERTPALPKERVMRSDAEQVDGYCQHGVGCMRSKRIYLVGGLGEDGFSPVRQTGKAGSIPV